MAQMTITQSDLDISGEIVKLLVGDEDRPAVYNVHASVLTSRSHFFQAALHECWNEGRSGEIELPEDTTEVVEVYLKFLYSKKLHVTWTEDASLLKSNENLPEYFELAQLYVFGEKVDDVEFKNSVADTIVQRMNTPINGRSWHPVGEVVDVIYCGTPLGSPARKLMLDIHLYKGVKHWISGPPEVNNVEFLMDLTRHLLASRRSLPEHPPFKHAIPLMLYHDTVPAIKVEEE